MKCVAPQGQLCWFSVASKRKMMRRIKWTSLPGARFCYSSNKTKHGETYNNCKPEDPWPMFDSQDQLGWLSVISERGERGEPERERARSTFVITRNKQSTRNPKTKANTKTGGPRSSVVMSGVPEVPKYRYSSTKRCFFVPPLVQFIGIFNTSQSRLSSLHCYDLFRIAIDVYVSDQRLARLLATAAVWQSACP